MTLSLTDDLLGLVARRFQVLGEPTRMRILVFLSEREASVQQLTDELQSTHQNVSKHLGVLYQAGMVSRRKEGNRVQYRLSDYTACQLIGQATASVTGRVEELAAIVGVEA
jgi:DNA-binding transcriptional ArsR family regulator